MATIKKPALTIEQKKARLLDQLAKIEKIEKEKSRKTVNRMKILLGAYLLDEKVRGGVHYRDLVINGVRFDDWVRRNSERKLFGLKELADAQPEENGGEVQL